MTAEKPAPDTAEEPLEVTAVVLPCVVATLLPDGNLDIAMPNGPIPVDKMFTIGALVTRMANQTLDEAARRGNANVLEIARDMTEAARRAKPQ